MKKLLFLITLSLLALSSCKNDGDGPSPFPNDFNGNDDLNPAPPPTPGPTPTPTPAPPVVIHEDVLPSDLNKNDTTLVYRKFIKPVQLNEPRKHRHCHDNYKDQCVVNRQVLFQFNVQALNEKFPKEIWDVTKVNLLGNYYSVGKNHRTELFCLLNLKRCSGRAITKIAGLDIPFLKLLWRNQKFWVGRDEDHVVNDLFHNLLEAGRLDEGLYLLLDQSFDLGRLLNLDSTEIQTLVRKNESLHFSVTDDTFVENPLLTITFKRRVPEADL